MLKIWGRANSSSVKKVVWFCEEAGVPYDRTDAGLAHGLVNTPEYRRLNPNGLVPTIEDDGFVLWESNAILRYLGAKHSAGRLYPDDLRIRADGDRWMDWLSINFWPAFRIAYLGLTRTPPAEREPERIAAAAKTGGELLAMLDTALTGRDWIAGRDFTVADIAFGPLVYLYFGVNVMRPKLAHLEAWYARLSARPAFATHVALPIS